MTTQADVRPGAGRAPARLRHLAAVGLAATALALGGCSVHLTKSGVSGDIFGHHFSAAEHALPAGFPSSVPTPTGAKVLYGGGTSGDGVNGWDVIFAVPGTVASATSAYADQLRAAGYTVTDLQLPPSGSGNGDDQGAAFHAADDDFDLEVAAGSSSSATHDEIPAGHVGLNLTVTPAHAG